MSARTANWPDRSKAVALAIREIAQERLNRTPALKSISLKSSTVASWVVSDEMFDVTRVGRHCLRYVNDELARIGAGISVRYEGGRFVVDVGSADR